MNRENFILMTVGGLTLDPVTKTPIVILRDHDNRLNLPIWIGLLEATAMATELEGIKMALEQADGSTRGTMNTSMQLSGKAAAMSRGVIDDVSKRLVEQFAQNLEGIVGTAEQPEGEEAPAAPSPPPADDALDVGQLAGGMAADRARDPKVLAGVIGALLVVLWLIGRRS